MHLQIKPSAQNTFPLSGLLIRGNNLHHWLAELQGLGIDLETVPVYAIPGGLPDTIWGCFVAIGREHWKGRTLNANEPCQQVYPNLYIPAFASLHPLISLAESAKLFADDPHLLHPEFGLVKLDNPINWTQAFTLPGKSDIVLRTPLPAAFVPNEIKRAEIHALPPEEVIKTMEEKDQTASRIFNDKPLGWGEKMKLLLLKALLGPGKTNGRSSTSEPRFTERWIKKLSGKVGQHMERWVQKQQDSLEDLERRNQTEMEKLMVLFKNNPEEALKYAIPLDNEGTGRGGNMERFELNKWRSGFDLFNSPGGYGSGTALLGGDAYQRLHKQYNETARKLIEEKQYEKAAFVYLKLLRDHHMAASTLEDAKMYAEAASVYLKYARNKTKAAACYENGQMFNEAIELYKELKQNEKVGDLYVQQRNREQANIYYQMVADEYIAGDRYVKASLLYRNKIGNTQPAQELLLKGWRQQKDGYNCINNYFENISNPQQLLHAIEDVYEKDVNSYNMPVFLRAVQHEQKKGEDIAMRVRDMAYEMVATLATTDPEVVAELKNFNKDVHLTKDVIRYKAQRREG